MSGEPVRTCLGCRRARPKPTLVRLVRGEDGIVRPDRSGRAPGRGAYVCADPACVERALGRGRLGHAFRKPSEPDLELRGLGGAANDSRAVKQSTRR